ncbi:MAG: DUF58 domain-containing protein [Ignavibacteria bacterium]|nr:DUF58 domain-containing protein [Ignavibacteria bacterium]
MELRARLVVEGFITGLHKSPYHGFSVEFAEHRQYMPGDDIRHMDWKIYGRTDRFYIKQFEEETNLKTYLLLDISKSMEFRSDPNIRKIDYARFLSASLSYLMIKQQDAVGLALFDQEITQFLPPHATRSYLRRILTALEHIRPERRSGSGAALHQMADRISRRGLVVVISDLLDDPREIMTALKHFRHKKNEVIVMHLLDPLERSFAFGPPAQFRDLETDEMMTTHPWQIQNAYQGAMRDFLEYYQRTCRENRIDYCLIDTATTFDVALTRYLSRRGRLL